MGLRFRKTVKIANGIKMNVSKSGVSFTVGKAGKSINIGSKGTYLNLGLAGSGLSYRQKLTNGYGSIVDLFKKDDKSEQVTTKKESSLRKNNASITQQYEEYLKEYDALINPHKYAKDVNTISYFMDNITDDILLQKVINGDEETVEEIIGRYSAKIDLPYKINVNYELEDDILYVDLDLPEIEDLDIENFEIKNDELVTVKKTKTKTQEEYAHIVISLTIFLAALYFNASSYINMIVISGFTQRRNKIGELSNDYLISIKFLREIFEKTKLANIDDSYKFILQFENRINISATYQMKTIVPYDMLQNNINIIENINFEELAEGFKRLGYKTNQINNVIDKLKEKNLETEDAYFKEGLKLLKEQK